MRTLYLQKLFIFVGRTNSEWIKTKGDSFFPPMAEQLKPNVKIFLSAL